MPDPPHSPQAARGGPGERVILFGLPALCGLAIALLLFGPGAERATVGARVYGVPVAGTERVALRIETLAHYGRLTEAGPGDVELELLRDDQSLGTWHGPTDAAGWAEANLDLNEPLPARARVRVRRAGHTLVDAPLALHAPLAVERSQRCETNGDAIKLTACVTRGIAVPELPEQVAITVEAPAADGGFPWTALDLDLSGGSVIEKRGPRAAPCTKPRCSGIWDALVIARAPTVGLDAVARIGTNKGEYHGDVPLQAGGIWLDPNWFAQKSFTLRAATPKTAAYLSLLSARGRIWGAVVPMKADEHGFSQGAVAVPEVAGLADGIFTLIVASDPAEPEGRTIAWPLSAAQHDAERVEVVPLALLSDGMPTAEAREQSRIRRARWPVAGLILASAVAVLITLFRRARRARANLEKHLAAEAGQEAAQAARVPMGLAMLVAAALAVAFAILAGVAAFGAS
jgi:hypothetical protein